MSIKEDVTVPELMKAKDKATEAIAAAVGKALSDYAATTGCWIVGVDIGIMTHISGRHVDMSFVSSVKVMTTAGELL